MHTSNYPKLDDYIDAKEEEGWFQHGKPQDGMYLFARGRGGYVIIAITRIGIDGTEYVVDEKYRPRL